MSFRDGGRDWDSGRKMDGDRQWQSRRFDLCFLKLYELPYLVAMFLIVLCFLLQTETVPSQDRVTWPVEEWQGECHRE